MTRNHLLKATLNSRPERAVWRMTMDLIGQAFGARPAASRQERIR
ncbi:hypothetical protein [Brevundimonas sp. GCM10030266]